MPIRGNTSYSTAFLNGLFTICAGTLRHYLWLRISLAPNGSTVIS